MIEDYEVLEQKNKKAVRQMWEEINPLNHITPKHPRTLIDLLDDFFGQCVEKCPEEFLIKCKDLGVLTRCRKGVFSKEIDILPPPIDVAKAQNIVNRWNPPGKRYLYTAHSWRNPSTNGLTENEYTCFEEMRSTHGTDYTFVEFKVNTDNQEKYVIDMDFTGIEHKDIEMYYNNIICNEAQSTAERFMDMGIFPSKNQIKKALKIETSKLAAGYIGLDFLRQICQEIFISIDDDKCVNGIEREKAYKSFHILADYLEKKNIVGVIYPSTRTALRGKHSQNLVAFNVEDFSVVHGSLRTITYQNM